MPPGPRNLIPIERTALADLLAHAASAARLVGHIDAPAVEPLADHIDAIVHELTELLGDPHVIAAPVPSARSTFGADVVTERIESLTMAALVESGDL
jgi:hypothetical protein